MSRFTSRSTLCTAILVATIIFSATTIGGASTAGAQPDAEVPMTVSTHYIGNTTDAEHAFETQITLAPTDRRLNDTEITISTTERAFISPAAIETIVSTRDGRQVISRVAGEPGTFHIDRVNPGETVTIVVRLYPQQLVPDGEPLATVEATTQFVGNQRVLTDRVPIRPDPDAGALGVVSTPGPPLYVIGIGGLLAGAVLVGGGAVFVMKRRASRVQHLARQIQRSAVNTEARQTAEELQQVAGGGHQSSESVNGAGGGQPETPVGDETDETVHLELTIDEDN